MMLSRAKTSLWRDDMLEALGRVSDGASPARTVGHAFAVGAGAHDFLADAEYRSRDEWN